MLQQHASTFIGRDLASKFSRCTKGLFHSHTSCLSDAVNRKEVAKLYNDQRAAYKRAVSKLRKQYAEEVKSQRATDEREKAQKQAMATRKRLERQRLKNLRSVQNALLEKEKRELRAQEFKKELEEAQVEREARRARFEKARRLVLKELEEEAPFWLTTIEEVDKVLDDPAVIQELWGKDEGYVGTSHPTDDDEFWRYQSHVWDMSKTYPTPRQFLLERLEEEAYDEYNLDDSYWTNERLQKKQALEHKAKLRALVREEGRKALLLKQRQMMKDNIENQNNNQLPFQSENLPDLPKNAPPPSLDILANYKAMEDEGAKILQSQPEKFFRFENESPIHTFHESSSSGTDIEYSNNNISSNKGVSSGKPIALRDPLRDSSPTSTPYPLFIGRDPKPDKRTDKERKRDEKEERMWAAAQAKTSAGVEFAAEDDITIVGGKPMNYDEFGTLGTDEDREWEASLDPITEAHLVNTPRELRYTDDDINWVIQQLSDKIANLQEVAKIEQETEFSNGDNIVTTGTDDKGRTFTEYDFNYNIHDHPLQDVVDMDEIKSVIDSLNKEQLAALELLDQDKDISVTKNPDEFRAALTKIPDLSEEQIQSLVDIETSLSTNNELLERLENGNWV